MVAVLTGFASLAAVGVVGYLLARWGVLGPGADLVLSRLTFFVATPALMLYTVADTPVADVFSAGALVTTTTALAMVAGYALLARLLLGRRGPALTLGALSAGYVNAGNLGIPLLVFAVGDATAIAPVLLLQLGLMMPVAFTVLDRQTGRGALSRTAALTAPLRNPLVLGVVAGLVLSGTGWRLPTPVDLPLTMLAGAAVPLMLLAFGLSLRGAPPPGVGADRGPLWLAVVLKALAAPALAVVLGSVAGLAGPALLGPVIVAALPTAQNVFVYAMRYGTAVPLVRDTVLLTTAACVPVIVGLTAAAG